MKRHRTPRSPSRTTFETLEPRTLLSTGLYGQYFDDVNFSSLRMTRNDIAIDFDFGSSSPAPRHIAGDTFSARWTGQVQPEFSETYTFHVTADDGVRLWVRGQLLVDRWQRADEFAGDLNRDGVVNLADFNEFAIHFGISGGATWGQGDFNYDGIVNLTDFNLLAGNFGELAPPAEPVESTGTIALTAGQKVDIKLEYFEHAGDASVKLRWSSSSVPEQLVPRERLFSSVPTDTFTNPIIGSGADPWVTRWNDQYVYVRSNGSSVWVGKADALQDIGWSQQVKVWDPPDGTMYSHNVWAPELHYLDGKWYIYVAADNGENANHRMYVLEGNTQDPTGSYTFKGKIAPVTDRWAIDGTVLEHAGSRYFVWSGWAGFTDGQQNLYIAEMSNPWTLSSDRAVIGVPTYQWEKYGLSINEGPTALVSDGGDVHIIYSASGFWRQEYSLGQLTLVGSNPMSAASWSKKPTPVFTRTSQVVGVGHASFTTSPDWSEDWIVYHAHQNPVEFTGRDVRTQRFTWNADGSPNFGQPIPGSVVQTEPSGTPTYYSAAAGTTSGASSSSSPGATTVGRRWKFDDLFSRGGAIGEGEGEETEPAPLDLAA